MSLLNYLNNKPPIWKFYLPSFGVFEREVRRFFAVPSQTILAPLMSSIIYFALFGMSLGKFLGKDTLQFTHGFSYLVFLIPGVLAMENVNSSFQNPVSSIMIGRWTGTLVDILLSPINPLGLWCAYVAGALVRTFIISCSVLIAGSICAWQWLPVNWPLLFLAIILTVGIFAGLGIIVGGIITTWEQFGIVTSFILQPLTFFSGVFFSFESFPGWVQNLKYVNPIFYVVSMQRYAILGFSDISFPLSVSVSILFLLITFFLSLYVLRKGFGLRN